MKKTPQIKVCGMRDASNIQHLVELKPNYIGFIFYAKSPRYVVDWLETKITKSIPTNIKKVGVFVNAPLEDIKQHILNFGLDMAQLHGAETPEFCAQVKTLGVEVIKAFQVKEVFDFSVLDAYQTCCDYFLFDTASPAYGGSGHKFSWDILKAYDNVKPIFLSGGIGVDDASELEKLSWLNIKAIDINSKFEIEPALKNIDELKRFISSVRGE